MKAKGLKRVLSLVLSFALVLAAGITAFQKEAKAAEGVVFSVTSDKTTLHRGDTFTVSVAMSGNTEGEGLTYDLVFDETKLELQSSEKGGVLTSQLDRLIEYPSGKDNTVRATAIRDGEAIQNGTIMKVSFKVKEDMVSGDVAFDSIINFLTYDLEKVPYTTTYPTLNIEVTPTGISLDKSSLQMSKGAVETLTATVTPSDASGTVKWSSDNESVATVTQAGEVRAVAGGTANITAAIGRYSAVCEVTVNVPLTGIAIKDAPGTINRGETVQLEAVYTPADATNRNLHWTSSEPSVASVDENTGLVTGIKEGTATITVTTEAVDAQSQQPFTATAVISVQENHLDEELAQKISFTDMKEALLIGQKIELRSLWNLDKIISDNDITDKITVTWISENTDIATVNANGTAFGVGEGKTTITASVTAEDGEGNKTAEYKSMIEIEVKRIPLHAIAFDQVISEMKVGEVVTLGIIYNPADTTDSKEAVWTSSDDSVIRVENGVLKALKAGNAEITAKVGEKTVSCNITVKSETTPDDSSNTNAEQENNGGEIKTGDTTSVAGALILMLISGLAILTVMRKRIFL